MAGIGELSVSVTARTQKAVANIKSFRKSINSLPGSIKGAVTSMAGLATAAAGLVGVAKVGHEITEAFSEIDSLAKFADTIEIGTEKLQALRFATEETSGARGLAALDSSLERMVRRVSDAAQGTGEAVSAIEEMGLSASELNRMSPDEQFKSIADAISRVELQSDKARLAYDVFGREGIKLLNTLELGTEGVNKYEQAIDDLNIGISRFDASQIEKANDAFGRVRLVVDGIINRIAIGLAPVIEGVSKSFTQWAKDSDAAAISMSGSIMKVAKAIGFVRDGIEFWIRSFKSLRALATEFFAWYIRTAETVNKITVDMANKIPGVEVSPSAFVAGLADEMERAATDARKAADEAWRQPLPSQGIEAFFADMQSNIEQSRRAFEDMQSQQSRNPFADQINRFLGEQAKSVGEMIGKLWGVAHETAGQIAGDVFKSLEGMAKQQLAEAGIISAKSAEGFTQLRANLGKTSGVQEKILDEQKKEVTVTEKVVDAIVDLTRKIEVPEFLTFE